MADVLGKAPQRFVKCESAHGTILYDSLAFQECPICIVVERLRVTLLDFGAFKLGKDISYERS